MEDWLVINQVFNPAWGGQTVVANAATATAAINLPTSCREVVLTNTSATATTFVLVTYYQSATVPTGDEPTVTNGFPVLPASQVRISVGMGQKVIRTIASTADGNIIISPGNGG
jgi:hypothetical protein